MDPVLLLLPLLLLLLPHGADRMDGDRIGRRSVVFARRAMASTSQPLATQVALDLLGAGGSAVDAAVGANAALTVMEPTGCGLGGDLFALVWEARSRRLHALDASGRAPRGLEPGRLREEGHAAIPLRGPQSVTVPGAVDGWVELHRRFGRLPLADVLAPAIRHAREGFCVSPIVAHLWRRGAARLADRPGFAETFLPAPAAGAVVRRPALAATLERIAAAGREGFYEGETAARIEAFCRGVGCPLRREDLEAHASDWVKPVATAYRGHEVWEVPPAAQGIAVLQILNLLEAYDLGGLERGGVDHLHLLVEAKKIAFEDLARHCGDPAFGRVPAEVLVSKDYARRRRRLLDPERAALRVPAGDPRREEGDTVHLAVGDEERNLVSLMQSNYLGFGAGLCPPDLGFGLQNRGALFTLEEGHPNVLAPGKRPFHTIIPALVTRQGQATLAFGVVGGDMQPQGQVQVLVNLLDFGLDLQAAGDAPRCYHNGSLEPAGGRTTGRMTDGGLLHLESSIDPAVARALEARGHRLGEETGVFGGYQAVGYDPGRDVYLGAAESRTDAQAAGF